MNVNRIAFIAFSLEIVLALYPVLSFGFCFDFDNVIGIFKYLQYDLLAYHNISSTWRWWYHWVWYAFVSTLLLMITAALWRLIIYKNSLQLAWAITISFFLFFSLSFAQRIVGAAFSCQLQRAHLNILSMYFNVEAGRESKVKLEDRYNSLKGAHLYSFIPPSWEGGESTCNSYVLRDGVFSSGEERIITGWVDRPHLPGFSLRYDALPGDVHIVEHTIDGARIYTLISCFAI